jgi:hypothetical protein
MVDLFDLCGKKFRVGRILRARISKLIARLGKSSAQGKSRPPVVVRPDNLQILFAHFARHLSLQNRRHRRVMFRVAQADEQLPGLA